MEPKTFSQLEQARAYFYAGKLGDCYALLRRYFDRLPFRPEPEHAEFAGIFCRVLLELGKEFELRFYLTELERLHETIKEPYIAYTLGLVYSYSTEPRAETSRVLFESILKSDASPALKMKSRMMLADVYLSRGDLGSARALISSIEPVDDERVNVLSDIWRAVIDRREGKPEQALERLSKITEQITFEDDWYGHFSARCIRAMVLIDMKMSDEAQDEVDAVRALFQGRNFKTTQEHLKNLEDRIDKSRQLPPIQFEPGELQSAFIYADKKVYLSNKAPAEKLLLILLKKRFLSKEEMVRVLYGRQYVEKDDKLIYYHVHSLRKKLREFGVPAEALLTEKMGYRLIPEVQTVARST